MYIDYTQGRTDELYTNGIIPYFRAPHIFLGFPMRYIDRGWSEAIEDLPELEERRWRASVSERYGSALTDGMFMSSRDGLTFNLWPESFIRPGLRPQDNWVYGDIWQNWVSSPRNQSLWARRMTCRSIPLKATGGERAPPYVATRCALMASYRYKRRLVGANWSPNRSSLPAANW